MCTITPITIICIITPNYCHYYNICVITPNGICIICINNTNICIITPPPSQAAGRGGREVARRPELSPLAFMIIIIIIIIIMLFIIITICIIIIISSSSSSRSSSISSIVIKYVFGLVVWM